MTLILLEKLPDTCSKDALKRNELALRRMNFLADHLYVGIDPIFYKSEKLASKLDLVGPRKLPQIRKLMKYAVKRAKSSEELAGILNSDIILTARGVRALAQTQADIVILSRNDVDQTKLEQELTDKGALKNNVTGKPVNSGISCDGWFIKPPVWDVIGQYYPAEMLIGEPWWDTAAIHLSAAFSRMFKVEVLNDNHALHPIHKGAWVDLSKEALQARNAWFNLKVLLRTGEVRDTNV